MAPPPFQLSASSLQEEEVIEDEVVEQGPEAQADSFAGGAEEGGNSGEGSESLGDQESGDSNGIVPPLLLLGTQIAVELGGVDQTTSVPINLEIFPGCVVKRVEVVITEGAFVSGTLVVECGYLSGIELTLAIDGEGNVSANLQMEHEFLGLPTEIQAQVTEEGIQGTINVQVPAGTPIVPGLKTTEGNIFFAFGNEEPFLEGNIGVTTDDGTATGTADVKVDWANANWSGTANLVSQPRTISVAPGVDVHLPEGFQISSRFGSEEGLVMEGSATVVPQVTLGSSDGIEAGGTAEVEANLGPDGLDIVLKKVRLAVTGGLNAPEMSEVLESQNLSTTVDAGATLTLWFEENSLSKIDLEFTAGLDSPTRRIGRLSFAGQAVLNPFSFLGMLHAVTNASFNLYEGGVYTTSVLPGSQLFVSLDNSGIANVDASLGMEVSDQASALARLSVATSLPRGQGLSLSAQLELLRRFDISTVEENGFGVAILPTTGLGATLESGALTGIEGALAMEMADEQGPLLAGSVNGQIAVTDAGLSLQEGMAMASLLRSLKMNVGTGEVRVSEGALLSVDIQGGRVVGLSGQIEAVYDDGGNEISISASIDYDPTQKMIRSLDANMASDATYPLFNNKLVVSELEGGISIRNGEVIALGGHARLDAYLGDFTAAGEADLTWSNAGEGSSFIGSGWLEFSWFQEEEEDKYLNGRIEATIDGEQFSLLGTVQVGLMKGLSGEATVAMDQEMDPEISASLSYNAVLMEASELWGMEFNLGIQVPLIPGLVAVEAGVLFGMAINTRPLMVFGTVGVESWRPLSGGFPDFFAELRASWGIDIEAKLMAYLELILGIDGLLHLTGGVRAGIGLNIPIELAPAIALHGGEDGVWGSMGIDLAINPILKLLVEAYLSWGVLGLWDGEKIWQLVDQELGNMGAINWSGSFAFGDKDEPTDEAPAVEAQSLQPQGTPIPTPEGLNGDSDLGFGDNEQEPQSEAGLTGLTDGLEAPTPEEEEGKVAGTGLGGELAKVGEYAQGVAAVADLIKILADGFQSFIKGGPVGLLIWLLFKKPSKDEINEKRDAVEDFRTQLMDENLIEEGSTISNMLGILSGSYSIWIIFDKSKPYRDMVDEGKHEEAILEDRAKILEGMIKGWTGEKDERRILKVLQYTLTNESTAGVREMTELVGGPKRVRDQYESFLGQDRDERRELDRIFTASYGSNWEDNPDVSDRPTYTAEEGALVKRTGRTWEELAEQAFGHRSYVVYLLNYPYNVSQMNSETAYEDYQQNNNNNNGGGPILTEFDDDVIDPGHTGNTYNGPPRPQFQARIPTMGEVVDLHENGLWQQRFPVPGVIEHAHWFENYHMIALLAYGDAGYADALRAHNPTVPEVLEGVSISLPTAAELGPPWIEVAPTAIGSTGLRVWVASDSNRNPEMWMGAPDRRVTELAEAAMEYDAGQTAGQELLNTATFADDATQTDAENAVKVAEGLIDFILANNFGGGVPGTAWENAQPGDTVRITADQLNSLAKAVYGHTERAAWISAHNPNPSGDQPASAMSKSGTQSMMALTPTGGPDGKLSYLLPTWSEMHALDPLPAAQRGVAPQSSIEALAGDTWSTLAQKAYGNWELAVKLADYSANAGKSLTAGTQVVLPKRSDLQTLVVAQMDDRVASVDGFGDTGANLGGATSVSMDETRTTANGEASATETDNRVFAPGLTLLVKGGDTWSAIALATYDDFSLFVRLANHPRNAPFKTLPDGAEIYLPTQDELMDVPEFGLGLSPTGFPLLTEMMRVPTQDELHHVWVEDHATGGEAPKGVWMMASTPTALEPEAKRWKEDSEGNATVNDAASLVHEVAEQGDASVDRIEELPDPVRTVVDEGYYEGEAGATSTASDDDKVYIVSDKNANVRSDEEGHAVTSAVIPQGTLVKVIEDATDSKGKAVQRIEYLDDATKQHWTTKTNISEVTDAGDELMISAYSDVTIYKDPYSGKKVTEGTGSAQKDKLVAQEAKVKVKYEVDKYQYAEEENGTKIGWIRKANLISQDDQERTDFLEEYKEWLEERKTEVDALNGQSKLDRVRGILSQVESVAALLKAGTTPELDELSKTPAYTSNHKGNFCPPELVGVVRDFIEITEREIEVPGEGDTTTNLAHGTDTTTGGSLFHDEDWNTRLGVPTYRTQSDNLMPPEVTCAPTAYTMALERIGVSREDIIVAIDEKLSGHRKNSYRKFLWKQTEYRKAEYLKTEEGKKAAEGGGTVNVPDSYLPDATPPSSFTPTTAMPDNWNEDPVIPDSFTPDTEFDSSKLKTLWETKVTAYLKKISSDTTKDWRKLRGNQGGLIGKEAELAKKYKEIAQMEDLMDFFFSLFDFGPRTGLVAFYSQRMVNRTQKPGYHSSEDNVSQTEKLEGWSPEHREKIREVLNAGGAAIVSVYHKGAGSDGTHLQSIQAVTATGLTIDCPFGAVNPGYRRKSGTKSDMFIDTGKGDTARDRKKYDWKNVPDYDSSEKDFTKRDFTVTAGHNLKDNESRGKSTEISYAMINESNMDVINYIVLLHRPE
ncbi:MAG: hypothetical protein AAGN35_04770 [Bacteroidota bacterium]